MFGVSIRNVSGTYGLQAVDEDGDTPLHLAVMRGHYDTIIPLLRHGANYDATNKVSPQELAHAILLPACLALPR